MPRSIDDTLTPRNNANFPVVSGPVLFRVYATTGSLPAASSFPASTVVGVGSGTTLALYFTDGNAWHALSGGTTTDPSGHVFTSNFPGADLGAQIVAADASLGSGPGTIEVPDGNYLWTTHLTLSSNRVVKFGSGTITCKGTDIGITTTDSVDNIQPGVRTLTPVAMSGTGWAIKVGDTLDIGGTEQVVVTSITSTTFTATFTQAHNGTVTPFTISGYYQGPMLSVQDNTTVYGNGPSTIFDEPDSSVVFATNVGANIQIRDLTIQNIANTPGLNAGTSLPNVGFNNGKKCRAERITFINTRSLAVSIGGANNGGTTYAQDCEVHRCVFDGVKCITAAVVNGDNTRWTNNTWKNMKALGLDYEPNDVNDRGSNFLIANNTFDLRGTSYGGAGLEVQHLQVGPGMIVNNLVISDDYPASTTTTGMQVNGTHDVLLQGNVFKGYLGLPLYVLNATRCKVQGNHMLGSCQGFLTSLTVGDNCVNCDISQNTIIIPSGGVGLCGIAESATGTSKNTFHDNVIDATGSGSSTVPRLIISASNSLAWNNVLNGVMNAGVARAPFFDNIAFCQALAPANAAGNYTLGQSFMAMSALHVTGIKFYWSGANSTIDATLYDTIGTVLATGSLTTTGVGVYTVTFGSPVALSAYNIAWATFRERTGTNYQQGASNLSAPALPYQRGDGVVICQNAYAAGAALPNTASTTVNYAVEPVIVVP